MNTPNEFDENQAPKIPDLEEIAGTTESSTINPQAPQISDLEEIAGTTESPTINVDHLKAINVDLATLQEQTRSTLAKSLIGLLAATLLGVSVYIWLSKDSKDTEGIKSSKELITLIWTSEVTLVSGALGFYFASNKGS